MIRTITILIAALTVAASAHAQDLLVKRDGTSVRVKVLEVSKKKVKYVRFKTDAPVYTIPVGDIDYIEYPDGDRDTFGVKPVDTASEKAELQKWHGPAKPSVALDEVRNAPAADLPQYNAGDIYSRDGITGLVVITTDDGTHGVVMSLDETCLEWCSLPRRDMKQVGANDQQEGIGNMHKLESYIASNGLSWSDFPAFEWCRAKGEGWYLPSINEVWLLGTVYNGGSRVATKKKVRKYFNDVLRENGGKPLNNLMFYMSSTESGDKYAFYSHMNSDKPYTNDCGKGDKLFVRAFHKF